MIAVAAKIVVGGTLLGFVVVWGERLPVLELLVRAGTHFVVGMLVHGIAAEVARADIRFVASVQLLDIAGEIERAGTRYVVGKQALGIAAADAEKVVEEGSSVVHR